MCSHEERVRLLLCMNETRTDTNSLHVQAVSIVTTFASVAAHPAEPILLCMFPFLDFGGGASSALRPGYR